MKRVLNILKNNLVSVVAPIVIVVLLLLVSPETRSWKAVFSLIQQGFIPAVLGWGMLFNMGVGNWDFSLGSRYVLTTILAGNLTLMLNITNPLLAVVVMFALSLTIAFVLSVIVAFTYKFLQIPTLIASMGVALIYESLTRALFNGTGVHIPAEWMMLGKFPWNIVSFLVSFAIAYFIYYNLKISYSIRAVGSNPNVAKTNGIDPVKAKMMAFLISGLFIGIYCILSLSSSGVCSTVSGTLGSMAVVFDSMMCVLIGMSIRGKGNLIFALYSGALITQILKMGMTAVGLPPHYNKVIVAFFVIIFMMGTANGASVKAKIKSWFKPKKTEAQ